MHEAGEDNSKSNSETRGISRGLPPKSVPHDSGTSDKRNVFGNHPITHPITFSLHLQLVSKPSYKYFASLLPPDKKTEP